MYIDAVPAAVAKIESTQDVVDIVQERMARVKRYAKID
jgi:hypothetical protein